MAALTSRRASVLSNARPRSISSSLYQSVEWLVDPSIFNSILELDDREGYSFAKPLIQEFFLIAMAANKEMTRNLYALDYENVAFQAQKLKGSSSTLGFIAIASLCGTILDNANTIYDAPDAETMQKQRLRIRQLLLKLHTRINKTQEVATQHCLGESSPRGKNVI